MVKIAAEVSLAGVVDLGAATRNKIGNGSALRFMGGHPDARPERY
jgi:hypothetical protein